MTKKFAKKKSPAKTRAKARHAGLMELPDIGTAQDIPVNFEDPDIGETMSSVNSGNSILEEIKTLSLKLKDLEGVFSTLQARISPVCASLPKKVEPEEDYADPGSFGEGTGCKPYPLSKLLASVFDISMRIGKLTADVQDNLKILQI